MLSLLKLDTEKDLISCNYKCVFNFAVKHTISDQVKRKTSENDFLTFACVSQHRLASFTTTTSRILQFFVFSCKFKG